jgi:carbamoyl-phosphate synthase small subunit
MAGVDDRAWLVLSDGTAFAGTAFGARAQIAGEVVFNTSMTGYPELLTDPSYRRQIVTLTYPEIGNYGVSRADAESDAIQASGLVVRSLSPIASSWRSDVTLDAWLRDAGVPGIAGIDTRALVRHIRDAGAMIGVLSTEPGADPRALLARARAEPSMAGCALIDDVTTAEVSDWSEGLTEEDGAPVAPLSSARFHVVVLDLGVKRRMLRLLVHHGCRVTVVPANTPAEAIEALEPDGVFLTNGPGDPATATGVVATVGALLGRYPIFGICMGHQVLSQALGAKTFKTRFGHRGGNQPVKTPDGRVLITSQNHGFAVDPASLSGDATPSHTNVSDETNEGLDARDRWAFSVQYHPEAAPGPHDAEGHFAQFVELMERFAEREAPVTRSPPAAAAT